MIVARVLSCLLLIVFIQSCGYIGGANPTEFASKSSYSAPPTFAEIQANILQPKCLTCHSSGAFTFTSYDSLMATGVVTAGNPLGSALFQQVAAGLMPQGKPPLASTDIQAVYDWIMAGATSGGSPPPSGHPPVAPSGLLATSASSTEIDLTWTDNSNNETGFEIERGSSSTGPFTLIATTAANAIGYSDTGLSSSTTYYYRIDATNSFGTSAFTTVANATTQAPTVGSPNAPSGLIATAASSNEIDLVWTDNSSNETGFSIERSTSSTGPFTPVGSAGANLTSYADTGLNAATTYYYRVDAQNAAGNSGYASVASAFTFGTYTWIATNIFQPKCVSCHSGAGAPFGYQLTSYSGATSLSQVVPGNSSGSNLYQMVLSGSMPQGGPALTSDPLNAVKTWIDSGAANN
jgi:mono/diheme cytochrome c family protein